MDRQIISSGSPWEPEIGFSRAVRAGKHVFVSGTIATGSDGKPLAPDAYGQAIAVFDKIKTALGEAGAQMADVVRTRMFLVDLQDAEAIGRAHGELFRDVRPAATMLQVSGFLGEGFLVEIEVDAVIGS